MKCLMWRIPMMKSVVMIALTSCLIAILPTSASFPQGPGMRHGPGMGMRPWKEEGPCWRVLELNLSQEQKKDLDLIQLTHFRETQLIRAQLFTKRLELRELLVNPTTRIEAIRIKNLEIIELQSRQEEKAVEYLIKVKNLLTPEQLKDWCPEKEFPAFRPMMRGTDPMGPMHPKRTFPPTE
jgi:Spy/CpxP family protein refolding chaperone